MKPPPEPTIVPNAPTAKPSSASRTAVVGEKLSVDHGRKARRRYVSAGDDAVNAPARVRGRSAAGACGQIVGYLGEVDELACERA